MEASNIKTALAITICQLFFSFLGLKISHFIGAYLIYFVVVHHFHIDWNMWEAALIGIGMGLYIE